MAYEKHLSISHYIPDVCPICDSEVQSHHTPARDSLTGKICHDYCFRTESTDSRKKRMKKEIESGAKPTVPLRFA